jgi:hypothetical protein
MKNVADRQTDSNQHSVHPSVPYVQYSTYPLGKISGTSSALLHPGPKGEAEGERGRE